MLSIGGDPLIVNYNLEKLRTVLADFSEVAGIRISLCDTCSRAVAGVQGKENDFCQLLQKHCGSTACTLSDRRLYELCAKTGKPQTHRCHAGFVDMCVPVCRDGVALGYLIMGRMRTSEEPNATLLAKFPDPAEAERLYRALPLYTKERAAAVVNLATILVSYILTENLILTRNSDEAARLKAYVEKNLAEPLCAERICHDLHLSKTMLYRLFNDHIGCGVNQYLTARRIQLAKELLLHTALPVSEIGERVGIFSCTYFCRLFKQKTGMSPLHYRKNS
jgi:AraC-like DNA-binding protein